MGFIGLSVVRRFVDVGEEVVATYHHSWRGPSFLKDEFGKTVFPEQMDVADSADWLALGAKYPITGIVHMAAPGVDDNRAPVHKEFQTNIQGLYNALNFGHAWQVQRVTLTSSAVVFGSVPEGPFFEEAPLPLTAVTAAGGGTETYKKVWETLGHYFSVSTGLPVASARVSTYWGPMYYHARSRRPQQQILNMCRSIIEGREATYGDLPGGVPFAGSGADMTYVKDGAKAIQMVQMAEKLDHFVYHVSSGRYTVMSEVADALKRLHPGVDFPLQEGHGPAWKPNAQLDNSNLIADTGFEPEWPLERALSDYIDWLRENPV